MNEFSRYVGAIIVYILSIVLIGGFFEEYYYQETPCPLCLLQRISMIGIASGILLNLRFGIQMAHYALSYFSAVLGAAVSIRQILLHICPGAPRFGLPVFGLGLYTWAFIVFVCAILGITLLLFFYTPKDTPDSPRNIGKTCIAAFIVIGLIIIGNVLATLSICGLGACSS